MGVVGSLPLPLPSFPSNENKDISHNESHQFDDTCSYVIFTEIIDRDSDSQSNTTSDNDNKSVSSLYALKSQPQTVSHGPSNVRGRQHCPPTLTTGRRSKFLKLEGAAAEKREIRRRRNREAARKLKQKRIMLEQKLETEIRDLELQEYDLLRRIRYLESYKEHLCKQKQYLTYFHKKFAKKASATLKYLERNHQQLQYENVHSHRNNIQVKEEKEHSSSSDWQLSFAI